LKKKKIPKKHQCQTADSLYDEKIVVKKRKYDDNDKSNTCGK
jgi:hypothetical protein